MRSSQFDDGGRGSSGWRLGGRLKSWLTVAVCVVVALMFAGPLLGRMWRVIDPFGSKSVDRSGPALLQAVTDLHDYHAASATFDVVVDVEKDAKFFPSAIRGEHTTVVAHGTVDAGVNLSELDSSAIAVDKATNSVTITLPRARLYAPQLDLANTKVIAHKRGLLDRLGSTFGGAPASDKQIFAVAETKLGAAARASTIRVTAETNTRAMLNSLILGLGYKHVRVIFTDEPVTPTTANEN